MQSEDASRAYMIPRAAKDPQHKPFVHTPVKISTSGMVAPMHSPDSGFGVERDTSRRHAGHFVIVAIDFGTTFSGYAFSFTRDPDCSIHMMRKWEGGDLDFLLFVVLRLSNH